MKLRKANLPVLIVIAALIVYACVSLIQMKGKLAEAVSVEKQLQQERTELEKENAALEYAVENADDPGVIEDVARDKLGLVKPGDRIFVDPDGE